MDWKNQNVLIVGMARSGSAAAQLLHGAGAVVTVNDMKPEDAFGEKLDALRELGISFRLGRTASTLCRARTFCASAPACPSTRPLSAPPGPRASP